MGDNQIGLELMGHSAKSYTRYSVAMLSSNDGQSGLPSNRSYDTYLTFSQAFQVTAWACKTRSIRLHRERATVKHLFRFGHAYAIPGRDRKQTVLSRRFAAIFTSFGQMGILAILRPRLRKRISGNYDACEYVATAWRHAPLGMVGSRIPLLRESQLVLTGRYEIIRVSQQALDSNPATWATSMPIRLDIVGTFHVQPCWPRFSQ